MKRIWTRTLTTILCMLILVLPAMAADTPVNYDELNAAMNNVAPGSDAATAASIGPQGTNLGIRADMAAIDYSTLLTSWQPAAGYETPRMQMTNTGEERLNVFQGHDLTTLGALAGRILYAPSEPDNPTFRSDVAACSGATVDYFDASAGTPDVALLSTYDCVLVWADYPFADQVLFGDNLAAFVDGGGKVILGQWCLPTAGNYLSGAIMTAAYCPVTATTAQFSTVSYNNDGTDCVHTGVSAYSSNYFDQTTLLGGAFSDGTFNDTANSLAVAWRADRKVYYSPGNTGNTYGTGQWAQLLCNMCSCAAGDVDCACAGAFSSGDRVTATLSSPQGASGLSMGWGGTVICGAIGFPPLLISWDDWQNGHNGNGFCACPVDSLPDNSGWFVDCTDVTPSVNVDCACGGAYNTGDRVMALMNNPASQPDVFAGDHGTVISGYSAIPTIILISWDGVTSGHNGNGIADCPVTVLDNTSGWWVDCTEIAPVGGPVGTITCDYTVTPAVGTVPFSVNHRVTLSNLLTGGAVYARRVAGRIKVVLGGGTSYNPWRSGFTTIQPGASYFMQFPITFPAVPSVLGNNTFTLDAMDVTPTPYNQPPYPPSGTTCQKVNVVLANAP